MLSIYPGNNQENVSKMFNSRDPVRKTGKIVLTVTEEPVEIYGWVGDTRSKTRKDFRIFGVRNNEEWTDPDNNLHLPYPGLVKYFEHV